LAKFETSAENDMNSKDAVDEAIDGYTGDDLQAVLIGQDQWGEFLSTTGLSESEDPLADGVTYRGISCRRSIAPDGIRLLVGH
jgi:hypothetical protein|tara:strand:- start:492 stop:740 length:249 start_codon:yes stop_codon:yes gene_type:complete